MESVEAASADNEGKWERVAQNNRWFINGMCGILRTEEPWWVFYRHVTENEVLYSSIFADFDIR